MHRRLQSNHRTVQDDHRHTTLTGLVRRAQYHTDPMLMDINVDRLQRIVDCHLRNTELMMLEKKLRGKPSAALRGVCLNLLDRGKDARLVVRNTAHLIDHLSKNILHADGSPNYLRVCQIIGQMEVDIMRLSEHERGGLMQTLLMSGGLDTLREHHRATPADRAQSWSEDAQRR